MKLYNSMTSRVDEFEPLNPPKVGIYICGPTVYDFAHIGHARTYVNSDILVRSLRWLGFKVKVVMNITDVGHLTNDQDSGEDKVEKKAREEKKSALQITEFYTEDFWKMSRLLNIVKPNVVCKATEYISEMIVLVKKLEEKGFTYKTTDGIYFDTSKFADYGKLAKLGVKGQREGARVAKNPEKRNPTDFALWKLAKPGEKRQLEWESPWGKHSFPGWHVECSAMSMKHLDDSFDIHTGGIEHIAVHHTNEIAQSEAATGKQFVKYWFHSSHLIIENEKMSKSLKNYLRVDDVVEKGYEAMVLRYLYLTGHYRTTMNFTWTALDSAAKALKRLQVAVVEFRENKGRTALSEEKLKKLEAFRDKFKLAIENDLAMPEALSVVWEVVKSNIPGYDKYDLLMDFDQVLGLRLAFAQMKKIKMPQEIQKLLEKRELLRSQKKYEESDELRVEIEKQGFIIEDTSQGTKVKKTS